MHMRFTLLFVATVLSVAALADARVAGAHVAGAAAAQGALTAYPIAGAGSSVADPPGPAEEATPFFTSTFSVPYRGGSIVLASTSDANGAVSVDDALEIVVEGGGQSSRFAFDFSGGCQGFIPDLTPIDLTDLFRPGENLVTVNLRDRCGGRQGSSDLYLVNFAVLIQTVAYPAGWNLVAAPDGTVISSPLGLLYTFGAGDATYRVLAGSAAVEAGRGYWAYFSEPAIVSLSGTARSTATVQAPPGRWIQVGNPGVRAARVIGADSVLVYDPTAGRYSEAAQLRPGQGAWVISLAGGTLTISTLP